MMAAALIVAVQAVASIVGSWWLIRAERRRELADGRRGAVSLVPRDPLYVVRDRLEARGWRSLGGRP